MSDLWGKLLSKLYVVYILSIGLCLLNVPSVFGRRKYSKQDLLKLREEVREMFDHAYSGYLKYAYPYDELRPLTCDGIDTWGSYSLTLIDALDTLAVMGNYSEFRRVVNIVTTNANFDANINVSVFETNIRIVGGLLSAHLLSQRAGLELEPGWPCNGPLLRLAEDVARRLLPAFATRTGMPYGTVNLRYGVPQGETTVTCTAGVGTYILEFAALSRLTGDPVYEEVAMNALRTMFDHRSSIGLFGNHIDVKTGKWVARDSGIGAGVDSFFEYLVKGSILLNRPELMGMFNEARGPIDRYLKKNNWYVWASMHKGQVTLPVFQSLEAYWPGVLTLVGDVETALRSMHNYNGVWKQYGFTPEFYNIPTGQAGSNRESYPLRPELVESAMYLYRATGDPFMLDIGKNILRSIQYSAKTPCGYATIKDARDHSLENRMESFFLAETTKYLYLLFDPDNFIHNRGSHGRLHTLSSGKQCVLDSGAYIFNTEAHPIDASALQCCHDWSQESYYPYSSFNYKGEMIKDTVRAKAPPQEPPPEEDLYEEAVEEEDQVRATIEVVAVEEPGAVGVASPLEDVGDEVTTERSIGRGTVELISPAPSATPSEREEARRLRKILENVYDESYVARLLNSTKLPVHLRHVLEYFVDKREKLNALVEQLVRIENGLSPGGGNKTLIDKPDEPTFTTNEETKIENRSFDFGAGEETDGHIVTRNRVGERLPDEKDLRTDVSSLTEYFRTLILPPTPLKHKFDVQGLLESVRAATARRPVNESTTRQYELLTCRAQPFLIRLTIAGEFLEEK